MYLQVAKIMSIRLLKNPKFLLNQLHWKPAQFDERAEYPAHQKFVEIGIDFGSDDTGSGSAVVFGSDLTGEYVVVNADYRS